MDVKKIKLVLSIRSLNVGGAERQFIELVKSIDKNRFEIFVCTMYGGVQENIVQNIDGIKYFNLNKKGTYDFYQFYKNYSNLLKKLNPNLVYAYKDEMNLFSLWCKPKRTKMIWGFRASNMDIKKYGKVNQAVRWLQKVFSSKVDKIISNSNASVDYHTQNDFDMSKAIVIANGIDTNMFQRDEKDRDDFRKKYDLKETDIAISIVSRIDYMKGYLIFVESAKRVMQKYDNVYFFAVGSGDENIKKECESILGDYNNKRFIWLGNQSSVEQIYSGVDISSSSSFGEGFSNSIAEAMSCELPCVVTDVGDSAFIVDDLGVVVEANNIDLFTKGLEQMIESDFKSLGVKCRKRIVENFSVKIMVEKTEQTIETLL